MQSLKGMSDDFAHPPDDFMVILYTNFKKGIN